MSRKNQGWIRVGYSGVERAYGVVCNEVVINGLMIGATFFLQKTGDFRYNLVWRDGDGRG